MKKQTTSSLDVKRAKTITTVLIALVAIVAVTTTTTTTQQQQAQANILHDLGDAADGYSQGHSDGKDAGARGESSQCPYYDTAYCFGWNGGYNEGQKSRNDVDNAYDGGDDEDD